MEASDPGARTGPGAPEGGSAPRRHTWVWVVIVLLLIAAGIVLYRMHSSSQAASKSKDSSTQTVSVGVTTVQQRDVPFYLTGLGSVTAYNTVTVHTRVDGQIMQVFFKEGQFVREGDVLIEIDPRPYQVALDQAQGQLAKDVASQNDAKVNLNRYQTLWQEGVVARQQLDTQQATVGQFDGAIQSDKAQIDSARLNLTYSRITSPINGRVGLRLVDPGNIVHATDTNGMLVITQVQPIAVIFTLPEDNLPQVVAQMKNGQLAVQAYSRDDNAKLADGKLLMIDNQIDQTTGTVKLKSEFDNHDNSLWPNQFVNIRLFLSVRKDAIVVPSAVIQSGAQGSFAYVIGSDNKAEVRPIQVDFSEGNISVIHQGLKAGEQVVVDGADKLQSGSTVTTHQSTPNRNQTGDSSTEPHP
ncbi:MAG: MdtA/MuxA family multidrug efflux RND transporter periplasmic adaptor subunit [Candidatus Acidiferrales bacterium]